MFQNPTEAWPGHSCAIYAFIEMQVVRGEIGQAEAEAALETLQVDVPTMPSTQAVLVKTDATPAHPGLMIRLAGDRWVPTTIKVNALPAVILCFILPGTKYILEHYIFTMCMHIGMLATLCRYVQVEYGPMELDLNLRLVNGIAKTKPGMVM